MGFSSEFLISVYTGDRKYAGTNANAFLILHDEAGNASDTIRLNKFFRDNFERGCKDTFQVSDNQVKGLKEYWRIDKVEFWRDESGFWSDWYVDKIAVENQRTNTTFMFPVFRWIRPFHHYFIKHLDTSLPQDDEYREQREEELDEKRASFRYFQLKPGLPVQILTVPPDEEFSSEYRWNVVKRTIQLLGTNKLKKMQLAPWKTMADLPNVYTREVFNIPRGMDNWKSDVSFGLQRVCSLNNGIIELCTEIPDKLPVTEAMLEPLLEGLTIQQALDQKRLFLCDLNILEGLPERPGFALCVPIGLFFVDKDDQLRPVAIQLFQTPGPDNPIFLPNDDHLLWELVKMWYNNADANYELALTHLAFTHMMMEGVAITTHRQLSPSHPVFKFLVPHFFYFLAKNAGVPKLFAPNGYADRVMNLGCQGFYELVKRGVAEWRLDTQGTLPEDLKRRGVSDPDVLPCFPFRDDAMLYYDAIHKYAAAYVSLYYDNPEKLTEDNEIQNWVAELVEPRDNDRGGCGLVGVPGEGSLACTDQLVTILTSIVYTCTVAHASANFPQYDEFAYVPNYPSSLRGQPPKSKEAVTEKDIFSVLPDRSTTLDIMLASKLPSKKTTQSIGNFEVQYIFDPSAMTLLEGFRRDLLKIGKLIQARNERRPVPYYDLEPSRVPNSICN